jgi:signal transduction histidine kinase
MARIGEGAAPCAVSPSLAEALATAQAGQTSWVTVRPATGFPTRLLILPAQGQDGTVLALDEQRLEVEQSGVLERFVNQIAHDIRNHAFTIGLQAEMGERRSGAEAQLRGHFEAILRGVDALKRYLDELLLFGRPITLSPTSVDVAAFLREQVQRFLLGREAGAPPATVTVEAEGEIPRASWDTERIGVALRALLDNAVRSSTPPPPVTLAVVVAPDAARLEVRDAGGGIAPEVMATLGSPMAVRRPNGAGLGLAIVRKIAEAHHGTLELESGPGGTTARLILPWGATPA